MVPTPLGIDPSSLSEDAGDLFRLTLWFLIYVFPKGNNLPLVCTGKLFPSGMDEQLFHYHVSFIHLKQMISSFQVTVIHASLQIN